MLQFTRSVRDYVLYLRRRRTIQRDWHKRHARIYADCPTYRRPVDAASEAAHQQLWQPFSRRVALDTLRVCGNASGLADPRVVPEDVFAVDIEPRLNRVDWAPFFSHKSFCSHFFAPDLFPETYFHRTGGDYFDRTGRPIDSADIGALAQDLPYPLVCKPSTDTFGGKGVSFPRDAEELRARLAAPGDVVVQAIVRQHPFLDEFNRHGLNTLRVYTYRSVTTGVVHVLHAALRMGRNGSLDNETAGGIVCYVHPNGRLHDYAVDKHGKKFAAHPDTGIAFSADLQIPDFGIMKQLLTEAAARIPHMRLAGWDATLDASGRWRCVEVNLAGLTTRFAQYAGQPFFGDFTDEVIAFCRNHPRYQRVSQRMF